MSSWGAHRAIARRAAIAFAVSLGLLVLPASALADEIGWMYDPDAVVEIHLGDVSLEELDALEADPDEYVKGTFELTVDGVPKGPQLTDVGIRLKGGAGSGRPIKTGKSGLKIRFDEFVKGQLFFGIKRLTLNNMIQDPSMVHETLTYELFHALGLPASRTGYAFITLNGDDYGLFLNLETLDEVSLPQWFETTQHLYEADAPKTDLRPGEAGTFEVDEGDDEDISDLEALITAVNKGGFWPGNVGPYADLEQMTSHWAVERYVSHWDGYAGVAGEFRPNNYYLHSNAAGVFQMMPWGTDQTWESGMAFDEPAGGVMVNKCLADWTCMQLYREGLADIYCLAPDLDLGTRVAELATMLAPYQAKEDVDKREATAEEVAEAVEDVEALAGSLRPEQLADYLTAAGMLEWPTDPCAALEPEDPGEPARPPDPSISPRIPITAKLGRSRASGAYVATPLRLTGPGKVTQHVFTRIAGQRRQLCTGRSERGKAGLLMVRCHLPEWALEGLDDGPLELRVRIVFTPDFGTTDIDVRRLALPRR